MWFIALTSYFPSYLVCEALGVKIRMDLIIKVWEFQFQKDNLKLLQTNRKFYPKCVKNDKLFVTCEKTFIDINVSNPLDSCKLHLFTAQLLKLIEVLSCYQNSFIHYSFAKVIKV